MLMVSDISIFSGSFKVPVLNISDSWSLFVCPSLVSWLLWTFSFLFLLLFLLLCFLLGFLWASGEIPDLKNLLFFDPLPHTLMLPGQHWILLGKNFFTFLTYFSHPWVWGQFLPLHCPLNLNLECLVVFRFCCTLLISFLHSSLNLMNSTLSLKSSRLSFLSVIWSWSMDNPFLLNNEFHNFSASMPCSMHCFFHFSKNLEISNQNDTLP